MILLIGWLTWSYLKADLCTGVSYWRYYPTPTKNFDQPVTQPWFLGGNSLKLHFSEHFLKSNIQWTPLFSDRKQYNLAQKLLNKLEYRENSFNCYLKLCFDSSLTYLGP